MPQKISKLLSRRQANPFLQSQAASLHNLNSFCIEISSSRALDSSKLINTQDHPAPSLSVKVPERFSRVNRFFYKLRLYLWGDILPKNTLANSFFVDPITLAYVRLLGVFLFACGFGWTMFQRFLVEDPDFMTASSSLTLWGLLLGAVYFFFGFITQSDEDDELSWKVAYIIGEQTIVFNLLSSLVFYGSIVSDLMNDRPVSTDNLAYNIIIHGLCLAVILLEVIYNHLTFYEKHRVFLYFILMFYLVCDFCMGMIENESWKIDFEWLVERKYGIKMALVGTLMMEFIVFNRLYCWKVARHSKGKKGKGKQRG